MRCGPYFDRHRCALLCLMSDVAAILHCATTHATCAPWYMGEPDPVPAGFRVQGATYMPGFAGKYSSLGPATQLRSTTLREGDSGGLSGLSGLGVGALTNSFSQVFARYPEAAGMPPSSGDDIIYPVIVYGQGSFNSCNFIDNQEMMDHLASWGFIVVCPDLLSTPFSGDGDELVRVIK